MGREVRKVPPDWKHPLDSDGFFIPLKPHFRDALLRWNMQSKKWTEGLRESWSKSSESTEEIWIPIEPEYQGMTFEEWDGSCPQAERYMPDWPAEIATHFMMYENTTEGTPISPAFATMEELARWLADNNASACGNMTATYEQWLGMIRVGYAPSMATGSDGLISGVALVAHDSINGDPNEIPIA